MGRGTLRGMCRRIGWLGSLVVRASELRLNGRELFPGRRTIYRSVCTVMGDYLPRYVSHSGQLSLLAYVEREMSTGQHAVMLCGWGVKAEWLIPFVDKHVGGR